MMLALVLVCMSFTVFAEEDKTLYPEHGLNMETFDQSENFTVSASLSSASVTDQTVILDIYDDDLYSVEALKALQLNDTIFIDNEVVTVESLEWDDDQAALLINGGDYETGEGIELCFLDDSGDSDHMFCVGTNNNTRKKQNAQASFVAAGQTGLHKAEGESRY